MLSFTSMRITSQKPKTKMSDHGGNARVMKRELSIDLWRGIAVLSMIMTHAIAFFHIGEDSVVNFLGTLGGTISFGLFLFLSGVSMYYSFVRYDDQAEEHKIKSRRKKIITRAFWLLMGYYLLAFIATIPLYSFPPNQSWIDNIARIILFVNVPEFTEFILAFVFYLIFTIPFRRVLKFLVNYPVFLIVVGLGAYALGTLLYGVEVGEPAAFIKALLVGNGDWHRFPLLQYLIVYLLGMLWGKFMLQNQNQKYRRRVTLLAVISTIILYVVGNISQEYLEYEWLETLHRWPPSLTFIIAGLLASYIVYLVLLITRNLRFAKNLRTAFHFMGVNAFDFFVIHTSLLFIYKYITADQHYPSAIMVFIFLTLLLAFTAVITIIKQSTLESLKADSGKDGLGWIFSEKVMVTLIWVGVITLAGMAIFQGSIEGSNLPADQIAFKKRLIREQEWPFWWDHAYDNFRQVFISNSSDTPISPNTWYEISINHAQLVKQKKSDRSGKDVRIVFYSESKDLFLELPFAFSGINQNDSRIRFKLQESIASNSETDKYFLYYGNNDVNKYPATRETPVAVTTRGITLGSPSAHKLNGATNRKWLLKEAGLSLQLRTVRYTVKLDKSLSPDSIVTYNIVGSSVRGTMTNLGNHEYRADANIGDLEPGKWQLQATAREPENKLKLVQSGYTSFLVTYPVYIVWTQDWEGWDVPDAWLNGINEMANRYKIPMTHFFNPRIFIKGVMNRKRADQLTLWVQDRVKANNDEIGLHLHMFYDLVSAAGVTPRSNNYAPWLYGDGGGVAAYSYPVGEMKRILTWSQRQFLDNGLNSPISFRAGGWLAKENTLQALEETGFLIDSSGRTPFTSKGFAVPWKLKATTRPYQPSRNDINSTKAPNFDIWEFPNNGADAYWFSAKEMIRRFDLNYPNKGSVMEEPQVVNYLSHPQFYTIDRPKLEQLWSHTGKYLYRNDKGPVIYTTLENVYFSWDRE